MNEALRCGATRLRQAGIESSRLEARLLLAHALACDQSILLRDPEAVFGADRFACFLGMLERRAAHEPLAFILGHREFWSMEFAVSPATLIPRPDSETLIRTAIAWFRDRAPPARILDLGTGTGCLLLAALREFPAAFGVGVDVSAAAAHLAAANAAVLGLDARCGFLCGDWTAATNGSFDLVLSNPPYIRSADIAGLMPEIAGYEPVAALDGGDDGMAAYRRILPRLRRLLGAGGIAVIEIGDGAADQAAKLAGEAGFRCGIRPDLAGIPRAIALCPGP